MALPLPTSLSPSKMSGFKNCALQFRLSNIDRVPEPQTAAAAKGTLVHRGLQLLFWDLPQGERTLLEGMKRIDVAREEAKTDPEFISLELTPEEEDAFFSESYDLMRKYFDLEDPNEIRVVGTEMMVQVRYGSMLLRGIIDRLEMDADGELVVSDYKTGKAPPEKFQQQRLAGVQFYSLLCQEVMGRRPAAVQLLHLADPVKITLETSEQSTRKMESTTKAMWKAIESACERGDFRPKPSKLCDWCSYKPHCPAFGGDLSALPLLEQT